jgi:acyl-[acyl-carrier-protein]-phospholipid O-acyltransferase / long-chain-fatty-acid--[acyl-carrier-protein] ligase
MIRETTLRLLGGLIAGSVYKVKKFGIDRLPEGGFLLAPNHMTYVDAVVLQLACPRPIRFIVHESIYKIRWLTPIFRLVQAIPISHVHAKEAVKLATERIRQGEIVCIFPEGELTQTGTLIRLRKGFELIARLADAPVVPVWLDRLWGSVFSFKGGKYFFKRPNSLTLDVSVAFGEPLRGENVNIGLVRERLLELGEFCFQQRPGLDGHLARATLKGLKKHQFEELIIDGMDHRRLKGGNLLAAGIALSRWLKKQSHGERIAVVLPPGIGAIVANLGITLANKVAVNLNFTAGRTALESAIARSEILHAISAKPVMKRLQEFPWPQEVYRLEELKLKSKIVFWRIVVLLTPAWLLGDILGLPKKGDRKEAVLLFTSGTNGDPKGVVLSHRNIIGNVMQFRTLVNLDRTDTLMASLPFFHSFGCTVTLWHPLMEGVRTVTYPTPVDVVKNAELIERYKVTLLVTTPTFLRGYLKRAEPKQFESVKLLVAGAERLPPSLAESFEEKFGIHIQEGYGLTETAPVVSVNLPSPLKVTPNDSVQESSKRGSVGKLLPGQAAQIRNSDTDELLSPYDLGMLWIKGPNIFEGYLGDQEKASEVLRDGWFRTGDLARFDEDGFLYIEGRVSRFSKIAGEMVPHETIETRILEAFELKEEEERLIAIVGIPDEAKGESLVLLTVPKISQQDLRSKLASTGIPNLWIPRTIKQVEALPVLGTGKLDLAKCRALAGNIPVARAQELKGSRAQFI